VREVHQNFKPILDDTVRSNPFYVGDNAHPTAVVLKLRPVETIRR
jgi:hypothetical protein